MLAGRQCDVFEADMGDHAFSIKRSDPIPLFHHFPQLDSREQSGKRILECDTYNCGCHGRKRDQSDHIDVQNEAKDDHRGHNDLRAQQ